jgi:hypothetical protein
MNQPLRLRGVNIFVASLMPFEMIQERMLGCANKKKRRGQSNSRPFVEYINKDTKFVIRYTKSAEAEMIGRAQILLMDKESKELQVHEFSVNMFDPSGASDNQNSDVCFLVSGLCQAAIKQWEADEFAKKHFSLN